MFITFEGVDGSGKTTAIEGFKKYLEKNNIDYVFTREPGSTLVKETKKIREIILNTESDLSPMAEAILYMADRRIHLEKVIWPSIKKRILILCDRYVDSSIAYQGGGRKLGLRKIAHLNKIITEKTEPSLTFFFDLPPQKAKFRMRTRKDKDRIEMEGREFKLRVYKGYKWIARMHRRRIKVIDAAKSKKNVLNQIIKIFEKKYAKIQGNKKCLQL